MPVWDYEGVSTRTSILTCAALIAVATLVGLALYPQLPDPMPSHWDANGTVDGYMSRVWGVLLVPLMTAGLAVLLFAIPSMDPLRANMSGSAPTTTHSSSASWRSWSTCTHSPWPQAWAGSST